MCVCVCVGGGGGVKSGHFAFLFVRVALASPVMLRSYHEIRQKRATRRSYADKALRAQMVYKGTLLKEQVVHLRRTMTQASALTVLLALAGNGMFILKYKYTRGLHVFKAETLKTLT